MKTETGGKVAASLSRSVTRGGRADTGSSSTRTRATRSGVVRVIIVVTAHTTGGRPRRVIRQIVVHRSGFRPPGSTLQPSHHPANQGRRVALPSAVGAERTTCTRVQVAT